MAKILNSGASQFFTAKADIDYATGNIKGFFRPMEHVGLVKVESECSAEATKIHADNRVHASLTGAESDEVTVTLLQLGNTFNNSVRGGGPADDNGGYTFNDSPSPCAIMHMENLIDTVTGDVKRRLHMWYNCVLVGDVKKKHETDEDEVKHTEFECMFMARPCEAVLNKKGEPTTYAYLDETSSNKAIFDNLYSAGVQVPTF